MITKKQNLETELVASEDGRHTYEIRRTWAETGMKGLVFELYPTISSDRCGEMVLSTMHLMNHVKDFGWSSVRIVNLYSTVFEGKPLAGQLSYDEENIAYIEAILEEKNIADYDIVVAMGNSLSTHIKTIEAKLDIFHMFQKKGLEKQVKHIVPENGNRDMAQGIHPLFLGLHYGKEKWSLADYDIPSAIASSREYLAGKSEKAVEKPKVEKKRNQKKGKNENVLQNKGQP